MQEMPPSFLMTSSTGSPSTSLETAWRFPLQPPVNETFFKIFSSISKSIRVEQVPEVLYENVIKELLSGVMIEIRIIYLHVVYHWKAVMTNGFSLFDVRGSLASCYRCAGGFFDFIKNS